MDPLLDRAAAVLNSARQTRTITESTIVWTRAQRELRTIWRDSRSLRARVRDVTLMAHALHEAARVAHQRAEPLCAAVSELMEREGEPSR